MPIKSQVISSPTAAYQSAPGFTAPFLPDEYEFHNLGYSGGTGATTMTYSFDGINDHGIVNAVQDGAAVQGDARLRAAQGVRVEVPYTQVWIKGAGNALVIARTKR